MKKSIALAISTAILATSASTTALAGASANVGATTNYIFRGLPASADKGAVFGGVDYEAANGLYVGTWASTTAVDADGSGYEVDLYGGYGGEINGFGYGVGVTSYQYPGKSSLDTDADHFEEINLNGSYGIVEASAAIGIGDNNEDYEYLSLSASKELPGNGISLGGTIGSGDFGGGDDYTHVQLSAGKGDFTFAIDKASGDNLTDYVEDTRASLTWNKSFDF